MASEIEQRLEAVVLKVGSQSARIHIPGEDGQLTLRSGDVFDIVPGHIITFAVKKRWTFRGHAYASGRIEDRRIDAASLGLDPLPLNGGELINLRTSYEPYRSPDPYEPLWRKLTARRRASYEMDPIAWGAFPDSEPDASLVGDASDLIRRGDIEGGRDLLMAILLRDLRCIDAHGHLGNLEFDRWPERALVHYRVGICIGELSLPPDFDEVLLWGHIYNRPFLRCLHGQGLCLWRLDRLPEAQRVFERILSLNPNDNQGVRFCWHDLHHGMSWEEMRVREEAGLPELEQKGHTERLNLLN